MPLAEAVHPGVNTKRPTSWRHPRASLCATVSTRTPQSCKTASSTLQNCEFSPANLRADLVKRVPSTLLPRALEPRAQEILDFSPVLTLEGARQVGKSTLAQMLAASRPATAITLDDPGAFAAARRDPRGFVDQAPDRTLIIDVG